MRLYDKVYKVQNGEDADEKFFNRRFGSLDERVHALEVLKVSIEETHERIRRFTVAEANVILQDAAAAVEGIAQLATAITLHSPSELTLGTGSHQLVIGPDERDLVPQNAYVTLTPIANRAHSMGGYLTAYNAETGTMSIDITKVEGDGTYPEWLIGLAAPSTGSGQGADAISIEEIGGMEAATVQAALGVLHASHGVLATAMTALSDRVTVLEGAGPDHTPLAYAQFMGVSE